MAESRDDGSGAWAVTAFVVFILVSIVVKFWYVFATIAGLVLLGWLLIQAIDAAGKWRAARWAERAEIIGRCERENAEYNRDPATYLRRLQGGLDA